MLHPTLYECLPKVSLKNCLIVIFLQEVRGLSSTRLPTMFPHILHQPLKATGLAALGCCLLEAPQQPAPTAVGAPLCHSCAHIPCGRSALAKKRNRRPKSLVCRITAITQWMHRQGRKEAREPPALLFSEGSSLRRVGLWQPHPPPMSSTQLQRQQDKQKSLSK